MQLVIVDISAAWTFVAEKENDIVIEWNLSNVEIEASLMPSFSEM